MLDDETIGMRTHVIFDAEFFRLRARHFFRRAAGAAGEERNALLRQGRRLDEMAAELDRGEPSESNASRRHVVGAEQDR